MCLSHFSFSLLKPIPQILNQIIPYSWGKAILVKLTDDMQRQWLCHVYCNERITQAEIVQKHKMLTDIPANQTKDNRLIDRSDVLSISLYANKAEIPVYGEGEQVNFFSLLASIGGTFGLFLGLSGVTLFELFEALYLLCRALPALCRSRWRWCKRCVKKRKQ